MDNSKFKNKSKSQFFLDRVRQGSVSCSVNLNLLSHIYNNSLDPKRDIDALGIALIKNLVTKQFMHVGDIYNFSKEFHIGLKRLRMALNSDMGKKILDYNSEKGILKVNPISGLGYNIPFILMEDEVIADKKKMLKRTVNKKSGKMKIPVKLSSFKDLSYMVKTIHQSYIINHFVKVCFTSSKYKDNHLTIDDKLSCIEKYGIGNGLYEGVSVKRLCDLINLPQRTVERLLADLMEIGQFESVGREEVVYHASTKREAIDVMIDLKMQYPERCYYTYNKDVRRKLSNKYNFNVDVVPRMTLKYNKVDKFGNLIQDKARKNLVKEYDLDPGRKEAHNFAEPDIDARSLKARKGLFEVRGRRNNINTLKGRTRRREIKDPIHGTIYRGEDTPTEGAIYIDTGDSRTRLRRWFLREVEKRFPFHYQQLQKSQELLDQLKAYADSRGIEYNQALKERMNTHARFDRAYNKYRENVQFGQRTLTSEEYIEVFNKEDNIINGSGRFKNRQQYALTYEEYILNYSYRDKWLTTPSPKNRGGVEGIEGLSHNNTQPSIDTCNTHL